MVIPIIRRISLPLLALFSLFSCATEGTSSSLSDSETEEVSNSSEITSDSRLEQVSYSFTYEGKDYVKNVSVYLPEGYSKEEDYDFLYLLHGSTGSGTGLAEETKPLLDQFIADGQLKKMIVAFPTYYPDRSFVTSNYVADYPLNHAFGAEEITSVVEAVESKYSSSYSEDLSVNRGKRSFGGYSMGGVTTWEVLAYHPEMFSLYLPMAGDCWIDRAEDVSGDSEIASFLASQIREKNLSHDDIEILAMVGENDSTKYSMIPQIEALQEESDLFDEENLHYYENPNGSHSQASYEAEITYALPYLN